MTPDEFAARFDVSRETLGRLNLYADLLGQWSPRINLVARSTLGDIWGRHFADSAQLVDLAPPAIGRWLDLGSGAGFPGLVVAVLLEERQPDLRLTLVESDGRKCAFLQTAIARMALTVTVLNARIESCGPISADVISARALAPLNDLLALAAPFAGRRTVLLLPKGRTVETELTEASASWHIAAELFGSITDPSARIVRISDFHRRK